MSDALRPDILQTMIPANQRPWYGKQWPDKAWFKAQNRRPDGKARIEKVRLRLRELCLSDLFFMSEYVLRNQKKCHLHIGLHDELCHILQYGGDCMNLLPRGHLKSTLGAIDYSIWRMCQDQDVRIVIFSDTEKVSQKFLTPIKNHILHNHRLKWLFPELKPATIRDGRKEMWSSNQILIDRKDFTMKDPTVQVGSVGQTLTGGHCDVLILDDIVTTKTAQQVEKLEKVNKWLEDVINLLDPGFRMIVNGTRKHDADIYGVFIRKNLLSVYRRKHKENGKYIWPEPDIIKLTEWKKSLMSAYTIATELDNDPIVAGQAAFEPGWIRRYNSKTVRTEFMKDAPLDDYTMLHEWYSKLRIVMGVDPARSTKTNSANMTFMVCGIDSYKRVYGLDIMMDKLRAREGVDKFITMWKKWRPDDTKIETYGGDTFFRQWIQDAMNEQELPGNRIGKFYKTPHRHKDDRIMELQWPAQNGMIWFPEGDVWDEVYEQLIRFPYHSLKDGPDTLSYIWIELAKPPIKIEEKPKMPNWKRRSSGMYTAKPNSWMTA